MFYGWWDEVLDAVAAVIEVAAAIAVIIDEIITRAKAREIAKAKDMLKDLIVSGIDWEKNKITLTELNNSNSKLEITGTSIANDIMEGEVIYV